jgi:transposase-like protein
VARRRNGRYPKEFRRMAVERLKRCENIVALSEELGVHRRLLYKWRDQLDPVDIGDESPPENPRETKNLPGRKSDVQESQWLMKLHTYGLLRNSFRPSQQIRAMRTYWRQRNDLVQAGGAAHPADAEGADADEYPVGECAERCERNDRTSDH